MAAYKTELAKKITLKDPEPFITNILSTIAYDYDKLARLTTLLNIFSKKNTPENAKAIVLTSKKIAEILVEMPDSIDSLCTTMQPVINQIKRHCSYQAFASLAEQIQQEQFNNALFLLERGFDSNILQLMENHLEEASRKIVRLQEIFNHKFDMLYDKYDLYCSILKKLNATTVFQEKDFIDFLAIVSPAEKPHERELLLLEILTQSDAENIKAWGNHLLSFGKETWESTISPNTHFLPILRKAVRNNNINGVKFFIENKNRRYNPPRNIGLNLAIQYNSGEIISYLCSAAKDKSDQSAFNAALFWAVDNNKFDLVQMLIGLSNKTGIDEAITQGTRRRGTDIRIIWELVSKNPSPESLSSILKWAAIKGETELFSHILTSKNLSSQLSQPANQEHCVSNHDVVFR